MAAEFAARCLPPADVDRLITSCDLSTTLGIRDRAILLLLARLGLRAGDIVGLWMADIDWKEAWIRFCGKGHPEARLPLSQEVRDALVGQLQQRPAADTDTLFLRAFGTSLLETQWTFTLVAAR